MRLTGPLKQQRNVTWNTASALIAPRIFQKRLSKLMGRTYWNSTPTCSSTVTPKSLTDISWLKNTPTLTLHSLIQGRIGTLVLISLGVVSMWLLYLTAR